MEGRIRTRRINVTWFNDMNYAWVSLSIKNHVKRFDGVVNAKKSRRNTKTKMKKRNETKYRRTGKKIKKKKKKKQKLSTAEEDDENDKKKSNIKRTPIKIKFFINL